MIVAPYAIDFVDDFPHAAAGKTHRFVLAGC